MQQIEVKLVAIKSAFLSHWAYTPFHFFANTPFKSTGEEVMIVKHFAKVLIALAWKCDLGDEGGKLEAAYIKMEERERDLVRALPEHRANYAVITDSKSTDIKPPTFSGEPNDRLNFCSFTEDWDNYVIVKGPS